MPDSPPLIRIWAARDFLKSLDMTSDKLPNAREALAEAVADLLLDVASRDADEVELRALDTALAPHAVDLKGALLKALRVCACARGFLGLPALMEETRRLLCAAPAKGCATYLEDALAADIAACTSLPMLRTVIDLLSFMQGQGRLKKELGGFDLPAPHKKSCRTALNRATKQIDALEAAQAKRSTTIWNPTNPAKPSVVEMERDYRLDEAEESTARELGRAAAMDALFAAGCTVKDASKAPDSGSAPIDLQ